MEKLCQTCGVKGFSRAMIYCTECWDTAEHIYCLGLSPDDIGEDFSWICDPCKAKDELLAKMIIYGDKTSEMTEVSGYGPLTISDFALPAAGAMPVNGPIWRGAFQTIGSYYGSVNELEAFMPKTSYSEALKIVRSMQPYLCFWMMKRCEIWPKKFDELGATDGDIAIYIFPEFSSENDYSSLVEYMISNDLAMTATMANLELMVFTSLEIFSPEKQTIQGKYYLWGMFNEKVSVKNPSKLCKSSAAKIRISRGGTKVKQYTKRKKTTKIPSLVRCDLLTSLSSECKRARSKRGKIKNTQQSTHQEAIILHQTSDKPSQAKTYTIVEAIHQDKGLSQGGQENASLLNEHIDTCENNFDPEEIFAPMFTSAKEVSKNHGTMIVPLNTEENVEETNSDKLVRQLNLCKQESDVSPMLRERISECGKDVQNGIIDGKLEAQQPNCEKGTILDSLKLKAQDSNISLAANPENDMFSVHLLGYQEEPQVQDQLEPLTNGESNPYSYDKPVTDNQNTIEEKVLDENKTDYGTQFRPENEGLCMTPILVLEEETSRASTSPSTASTAVCKLDAEDTATHEASEMTVPASVLEMAGDYHNASSNFVDTQVGRYYIKSDLAPILTKILKKHGDIALDCAIEPKVPLENICKVVQDLESISLDGLHHRHVSQLRNVVQFADALGINMKWLHERCEDLEKLIFHLSRYPTLKNELAQCKKDLEAKEEKLSLKRSMLEKLQAEIKSLEAESVSMKKYTDKLNCAVQSIKLKCGNFRGRSVMEGLF